jgi:hypothetical protein
MKRWMWFVLAVVVIGAICMMMMPKGPNLKDYEYLKEPKMLFLQDQKVIEITVKGNPDKVAGKVLKDLFALRFKISSGKNAVVPLARYKFENAANMKDMDNWTVSYAIPVDEKVEKLPEYKGEFKPELKVWKYGNVGQLLHVGSYEEETEDITKLQNFIKEQGYAITGMHEEQYVKGPGIFGKGDPKKYITILSYEVKKTGKAKKAVEAPKAKKPAKAK